MKIIKSMVIFSMTFMISFLNIYNIYAETADEAIAAHQQLPIESNEIENWPQGPVINAESACLMDVNTGTILYQKNMDAKEFPASTTKIMTCLIAAETCSMNEIVTFSHDAVFGIEKGSSNVGMDEGQSITMEQALYCIMLASANEVASAVAEHISGSIDNFAALMNKKARELGCTNTHFANANGLHNDSHYTTAHDLALITSAYFKNEQLQKIASTTYYEMHATPTQPDEFGISNHHKMLKGQKYYYEYVIGGKTGYTNMARQTLTTCAEKGGMKLVCTVMRDESPYQFTDTKELFEYGFNNFKKWNIGENETKYAIDNADFFKTDIAIFGNSETLLSIDPNGYIILPNTAVFSEAESELSYIPDDTSDVLAVISYKYNGNYVGSANINVANNNVKTFQFGQNTVSSDQSNSKSLKENSDDIIFVSIKPILITVGSIIAGLFLIFILYAVFKNYNFSKRRRLKIKKKYRRYTSEFDDFDF